jgi:hypothetical protein
MLSYPVIIGSIEELWAFRKTIPPFGGGQGMFLILFKPIYIPLASFKGGMAFVISS